jgi:hypothetical protein
VDRKVRQTNQEQPDSDDPRGVDAPEDKREAGERQRHEEAEPMPEWQQVMDAEPPGRKRGQPEKCFVLDSEKRRNEDEQRELAA